MSIKDKDNQSIMKRFFNILSSVVLLWALAACEAKLPPIVINPDPVFDKNGTYIVNTISIYDTEETVITVSRIYGLSKELDMTVGIDEALLARYNEQNGTSYELMPEEYYTIPEAVKLDRTVKEIEVPVVIKPKALVTDKGLAKANTYVIPLSITQTSLTLDDQGAAAEVILLPNVVGPDFTVKVPEEASVLSFISGVPFTQDVVITAVSNFTTVNPAKVTYSVDETKVAEYNTANGTDYKLLGADYYTVNAGNLDLETMDFTTAVTFDCAELDGSKEYILPLVMESDAYGVNQKLPVYVVIKITTLHMWVVDADKLIVSSTGKGTVGVGMNAPIVEDQPVNFKVDNTKLDAYNAANGTSYAALDAAKVTVTATSIAAGEKEASLEYKVDMSSMKYDDDVKYLVPLVLDRTDLFMGTNVDSDIIYIQPYRTLAVEYTKEVWGEEKSNRKTKAGIQTAATPGWRASKRTDYPHKYAFQYNEVWADGLIYFDILVDDTGEFQTVGGKANQLKLGNFMDRPYAVWQGYDQIIDEGESYVDTETGIVHIDLMVLDNAYKAEGGFPIQVNFIPM